MSAEQLFKGVVGTICAYESIAIASGRLPTVTKIVHRYPVVGAVVLAGLSHHFYQRAVAEV